VPVNGSASDQDALELACIVARRHRARVEAVFVIQVKRSLPLDADMSSEVERGEDVLDRAEQTGTRLEVELETSLLQARDIGACRSEVSISTSSLAAACSARSRTASPRSISADMSASSGSERLTWITKTASTRARWRRATMQARSSAS